MKKTVYGVEIVPSHSELEAFKDDYIFESRDDAIFRLKQLAEHEIDTYAEYDGEDHGCDYSLDEKQNILTLTRKGKTICTFEIVQFVFVTCS